MSLTLTVVQYKRSTVRLAPRFFYVSLTHAILVNKYTNEQKQEYIVQRVHKPGL